MKSRLYDKGLSQNTMPGVKRVMEQTTRVKVAQKHLDKVTQQINERKVPKLLPPTNTQGIPSKLPPAAKRNPKVDFSAT